MKVSRYIPVAILSVALVGGTAAYSIAQSAPEAPRMGQQMKKGERGKQFAERGMRGDCQGGGMHRKGRHGMKGHGGRGRGEIFADLMDQVDADGNKEITKAEIDAYKSAKFSQADASGDGTLSIEEFDTVYRELTRTRMVDMFQKLDADGDGNVTSEELDKRIDRIVDRMDRDGDGVLKPMKRKQRG